MQGRRNSRISRGQSALRKSEQNTKQTLAEGHQSSPHNDSMLQDEHVISQQELPTQGWLNPPNLELQEFLVSFSKSRPNQDIVSQDQHESFFIDDAQGDRISLKANLGDELNGEHDSTNNQDRVPPQPYQQSDGNDEIVDSRYLKDTYFKEEYYYDKGTNMPKHFVRLFFRYSDRLSRGFPVDRYQRNRNLLLKKLEADLRLKESNTLKDLLKLFGDQQLNSFQTEEARRRRSFFQEVLCSFSAKLAVLANESVAVKQHYLYSMKMYEWRLNSGDLVGNLN